VIRGRNIGLSWSAAVAALDKNDTQPWPLNVNDKPGSAVSPVLAAVAAGDSAMS
jgi:hypothetical protein